jgi:hypothetical protein
MRGTMKLNILYLEKLGFLRKLEISPSWFGSQQRMLGLERLQTGERFLFREILTNTVEQYIFHIYIGQAKRLLSPTTTAQETMLVSLIQTCQEFYQYRTPKRWTQVMRKSR